MKLEVTRVFIGDDYTIGHFSIDGKPFSDTLEDLPRKIKIKDKTCIPKGTYKVGINQSTRFKRLMPEILNVPGFTGIRIHAGNTDEDTSGCILVGENSIKGMLINSRETFNKLFDILNTAFNAGEKITITIK